MPGAVEKDDLQDSQKDLSKDQVDAYPVGFFLWSPVSQPLYRTVLTSSWQFGAILENIREMNCLVVINA